MTINIHHKRILLELESLEEHPFRTSWNYLEMKARCLRYLQSPEATQVFFEAIEAFPYKTGFLTKETTLANLFRLAGDTAQAQKHYQAAYTLLQQMPHDKKMFTGNVVSATVTTYMLGKYEECIAAVSQNQISRRRKDWLLQDIFPPIIDARQRNDVTQALEWVRNIEAAIKKNHSNPWGSGSDFSLWDAYELARETVRDLGGDPDAA